MTNNKHQMFTERYQADETPWDTGITPPEIEAIVTELKTGRALDLGCGTGTNVGYLLEHDWQADGVDFVQKAIDTANIKLADFSTDVVNMFCHDVTQLDTLAGLRPPYDLVIDIGCGHAIPKSQNEKYARDIANLMSSEGTLMLYVHQPREGTDMGWTAADVRRLFSPYFDVVSEMFSEDTSIHLPSIWYRLTKRA